MTYIEALLNRDPKDLTEDLVSDLVDARAALHEKAPAAEGGSVKELTADIEGNLKHLANMPACFDEALTASLKKAFAEALVRNHTLLQQRQKTHVRNIEGVGVVDTFYDLAGALFALILKDRRDLVLVGLNRYLKRTDDFAGLRLVYFYGAMQALHQAVQLSNACEGEVLPAAKKILKTKAASAAEFALFCLQQPAGNRVVAIGGLSGSGKTTLGRALSPQARAVHIRSDAVRKHLFGVPVETKAPIEAYSVEHSEKTYRGLEERLAYVLDAGFNVIVDGVYAQENDRDSLENLCHQKGVLFTGVWCSVPADVAQKRIVTRMRDRTDDTPTSEVDLIQHEKQLLLNPGRITWHRLDTLYGVDQLVGRCVSLLELSQRGL